MPPVIRALRRTPPVVRAVVLALGFPALASAQGQTPTDIATPTAADLPSGARVFTMYCARCHGFDGSGGSGPPLARPRLRRAADTAAILDIIVNGQNLLVSGWELGASRYIAGRAAAVRVPVGKGQAVVMAIRPHWRGQPHNTFKLLFNRLYLSTRQEG